MNVTMLLTAERVHLTIECMHLQVPLTCIIQICPCINRAMCQVAAACTLTAASHGRQIYSHLEWTHCTRGGRTTHCSLWSLTVSTLFIYSAAPGLSQTYDRSVNGLRTPGSAGAWQQVMKGDNLRKKGDSSQV